MNVRNHITTASSAAATEAPPASGQQLSTSSGNGAAKPIGATTLTFQEAVARLQEYWASVGCAVWQPFNSEVGAGTMNPATFLRVLGPEPWRVCYVEPSVRPDDSRYGDNPNRLQQHTQFQVILKPDPGRPQELYLGSLEALGIDVRAHDVRFVEDNWENPTLGAWGLGWEVWMDGQEVTQYTYFQQAAGQALPVPSVEITYGLERILTALQGVKHFKDIRYTATLTYGEMLLQNEYEMSCYNLDNAHVPSQQQLFELHQQEAKRLVDAGLPIPAYGQLLKLSHAFNILDARGAVGVTERATCFAAMRSLARQIAGLWMKKREELGHPLGQVGALAPPEVTAPHGRLAAGPADLVIEIGCEELPPAEATAAVAQLRRVVPNLLERLRLGHGEIMVESTPRRLAVIVQGVDCVQSSIEEKIRGPPAKAAFGPDGQPTKALAGFAAKNGVSVEDVTREADAKGTEYVWAVRKQQGRHAAEVLTEEVGTLVGGLSFGKSMRWNGTGAAFSRPVRWLVGMHGEAALPFSFAGLQAGRTTRGLRNGVQLEVEIASASDYENALQNAGITLGVSQRSSQIWRDATAAAADVGGIVPEAAREALLHEVTHLVEAPTVVWGDFSRDFLQLPREVLVMVMRKHQRYFPVYEASGEALLPHFITVANGQIDVPTVRAGNEAVLRARFEDAQFFYAADLKQPLEAFLPKLAGTQFHKDLGNLLQKSERVTGLIRPLAELTGLTEAGHVAEAAARLARADLATSLVTEMTGLAGTMGRHYALQTGTAPDVAEAIFEAVLPRNAGDAVPRTPAGILVAVADRLDSLVGLFAAGAAPSASADPFALRRSAYGMLEALVSNGVRLDLNAALAAAAAAQPIPADAAVVAAVLEFVTRRLEQLLVDGGCGAEVVRAVLSERGADPYAAAQSARNLQACSSEGETGRLPRVMAAFARPTRIVRGKEVDAGWTIDESRFELEEERALWGAYQAAAKQIRRDMSIPDFLQVAESLVQPVDAYFEQVFVMCDDEATRQSRLALLRDIADLPSGIVNFALLPGF
ncbi:g10159 [Coccomyxa elongata]